MKAKSRKQLLAEYKPATVNPATMDRVFDRMLRPDLEQPVGQPYADRVPLPARVPSSESEPLSHRVPLSTGLPYSESTVISQSTVTQESTVTPQSTAKPTLGGHLKMPYTVADGAAKILPPFEWAVYFRLFRLSHGWHQDTCLVGNKALLEATNMSEVQVRRSIQSLVLKRLVEVIEVVNTGPLKGTRYKINTVISQSTVTSKSTVIPQSTVISQRPNKHDHDSLQKDHHQSVMTTYQTLTGRIWTKADTTAYQTIADLPADRIEELMAAIHNRAADPPGSMAYYAKSILTELAEGKGSQPRAAARKRLERIAQELRTAHVGDPDYAISDAVADLKTRCAREGIIWDDDLANEVLGIG